MELGVGGVSGLETADHSVATSSWEPRGLGTGGVAPTRAILRGPSTEVVSGVDLCLPGPFLVPENRTQKSSTWGPRPCSPLGQNGPISHGSWAWEAVLASPVPSLASPSESAGADCMGTFLLL
jgi:hypothetical protein